MIHIPNEVAQVYVNGVVFQGTSETRKKPKRVVPMKDWVKKTVNVPLNQ